MLNKIFLQHENFLSNNQGVYNDIALLILSSEVTLNEFIQIACLSEAKTDSFPKNGVSGYAVGYNFIIYYIIFYLQIEICMSLLKY